MYKGSQRNGRTAPLFFVRRVSPRKRGFLFGGNSAIRERLDRNASAKPKDVLAVKRALARAGLYQIPRWGFTDFPDEAMFRGIEALQRQLGHPRADGIVRPGDRTATDGRRPFRNTSAARPAKVEKKAALRRPRAHPAGGRMTNHVDIRIRNRNGVYKDPTPLIRSQWPGQ